MAISLDVVRQRCSRLSRLKNEILIRQEVSLLVRFAVKGGQVATWLILIGFLPCCAPIPL